MYFEDLLWDMREQEEPWRLGGLGPERLDVTFIKMGKAWVDKSSLRCPPDIQVEMVSRELEIV